MNKKNYQKPSFRVIKIQHRPSLLGASQQTYIPGMAPEEQNKLA